MSILNVEHLTHGFGDRAIFNDVSFRLLKGEHIGLIGANGEGKSTFMNIITGKLMPDEGKVEWAKNVRVGYLDQHTVLTPGMTIRQVLASAFDFLYDMEAQMNEICDKMGDATSEELEQYMEDLGTIQDLLTMHDFYMIDAKVEEVARALGLMDIGLDRDVTELSGGQRTKVLLGKLLLEKPDILLLDEPTNYLDAEHIEWLKRYLNEYENAFILISHDIPFLNSVINLIYHMDNQELTRYVGDYDKFQEVYAMKKSQLEAAYNRQQKEIADLRDFVARNKARVSTRNMAMSRQKKLDKMDVIELAAEKPKPEFSFKEGRTTGRIIFETKDLIIGYDEPLSKPLNLSMERGEKVALIGANGIGKTTLLKEVAKSILNGNPKMHMLILLIDERPEEVTDIKEAIHGDNVEVIYSTFDELPEHHKRVSEMVIERAKRLVEHKKDVVILLDSITRLTRAYNLVVPPSGRTLSGGLDPAALHMPKRFFGAARNMREGGSLTILATALVETGSKMDDVVYEEFKGTGNMEMVLDRKLSEKRIFPAIDLAKSGTRREDLLLTPEELEAINIMRKALNGLKPDEATDRILDMFSHTRNNVEFVNMVKKNRFI